MEGGSHGRSDGRRAGLRPVDLARAAGISTQQVRNLLDAGILPAARRTPVGYRRFEPRHLRALLTYRALGVGYGREGAQAIMRAVNAGDLPLALAHLDAGHADLHQRRRELEAAADALATVAGQAPDAAVPRSGRRIGEVATLLGVRASALRVWEAAGLLSPPRDPGTNYRAFGPVEIRDARMIGLLRQGGHPLPQIRGILDGLRRTGSSQALRDALAQRRADLTRRATAMLAASSRLHHHVTTDMATDVTSEEAGAPGAGAGAGGDAGLPPHPPPGPGGGGERPSVT